MMIENPMNHMVFEVATYFLPTVSSGFWLRIPGCANFDVSLFVLFFYKLSVTLSASGDNFRFF